MWRLLQIFQKYQGARSGWMALPPWARLILLVLSLPGIACIALCAIAFCVSILALLLLTVPAYRLLSWLTGAGAGAGPDGATSVSPGATYVVSKPVGENEAEPDGGQVTQGVALSPRDAAAMYDVVRQTMQEMNQPQADGASPDAELGDRRSSANRRHIEVKIIE